MEVLDGKLTDTGGLCQVEVLGGRLMETGALVVTIQPEYSPE